MFLELKRLLLLTFTMVSFYGFSQGTASADSTHIPDVEFRAFLSTLNQGGVRITVSSLGNISNADAGLFTGKMDVTYGDDITDLTGIKAFTNITELDCYGFIGLTSIDVSGMTALKYLAAYENGLTALNITGSGIEGADSNLDTEDNSGLTCIKTTVSSTFVSQKKTGGNWLFDSGVTFSPTCGSADSTTVPDSTTIPDIINESPAHTALEGNTETFNLETVFTGAVSYAISSASPPAFVTISESVLTFNPGFATTENSTDYTFKVTATNILGTSPEVTFTLTVNDTPATAIPDGNFEQALIDERIDTSGKDGYIKNSDASSRTSLYLANKEIANLSGIEAFANITSLTCFGNSLTSLDVSKNTLLANLDCTSNALTSLDVSGMTTLVTLRAHGNPLTALNIKNSGVEGSSGYLSVDRNDDLTCIKSTLNAKRPNWYVNNDIRFSPNCGEIASDSAPLVDNSNPSATVAEGNTETFDLVTVFAGAGAGAVSYTISSTSPPAFVTISESVLTFNPGFANTENSTDYSFEVKATNVNGDSPEVTFTLTVNDIPATAIPDENFEQALIDKRIDTSGKDGYIKNSDASRQTSLDVRNKEIANLSGIEAFTNITFLSCFGNSLTSLDVSKNTLLATLDCTSNPLSSLNISGITTLTNLRLFGNVLTSLDVSANTALTSLDCSDNMLTSLDVSGMTTLVRLTAHNNQLTVLNVKNSGVEGSSGYLSARSNDGLTCIESTLSDTEAGAEEREWFYRRDVTFGTSCTQPAITSSTVAVGNITVLEGNTFEQTITHNYDEDEAPTGYTLTLADGTTAPNWITLSNGKVVASPLYGVVESGLTHKQFSFKVSTSGKTPNVEGEFTVTVINNSENPITYDGNLNSETMSEDTVGLYNILSHYTSAIGLSASFQLKPDGNRPNWVTFPNNKVRLAPTNSEVGTHVIPFKIVDVLRNEFSGELNLTVTNVNDAPIIIDITAKPIVKLLKTLRCDELSSNITETFDLSTVFSDVDTDIPTDTPTDVSTDVSTHDVLTYEILPEGIVRSVKVSNPNFASLENSTLTFAFTTGSKYNGIYSMGIKATDKSNESVTSVITLIVGSYSSSPENSGLIVMTTCPNDDVPVSGARAPKSKSASSMSVRLGGSAISNRGETIGEKGVIYSTSANNGESLRIGGQGVSKEIITNSEGNSFSKKISGLTADITYHYRAYVIRNDVAAYGDVRDFILRTDNSLGNESIEEVDFYISPNPSSDILNINVVEKTDYRLLNIRGQVLKRGVLPRGKSKISISSFAKGIYFLNLKTSKSSFTKKIIRK